MFRHRIYIQSKTEGAQNEYGEPAVTWANFQECQARIEAMSGRELETAQQTWAEARFKVTTHYLSGVEREMRVVWGGLDGNNDPLSTARLLDILDAEDPTGAGTTLVMICKSIPSE
jgi:SPP1 family predicted phage head-tail adaptor